MDGWMDGWGGVEGVRGGEREGGWASADVHALPSDAS